MPDPAQLPSYPATPTRPLTFASAAAAHCKCECKCSINCRKRLRSCTRARCSPRSSMDSVVQASTSRPSHASQTPQKIGACVHQRLSDLLTHAVFDLCTTRRPARCSHPFAKRRADACTSSANLRRCCAAAIGIRSSDTSIEPAKPPWLACPPYRAAGFPSYFALTMS